MQHDWVVLGISALTIIMCLVGLGYLIFCPMELTEQQKKDGWTGPNTREEAIGARVVASAALLFLIFCMAMMCRDSVGRLFLSYFG